MDGPCIDVMVWCTGIVKRKLRNMGWTGVSFEFDDAATNNGSVSSTTNIDGESLCRRVSTRMVRERAERAAGERAESVNEELANIQREPSCDWIDEHQTSCWSAAARAPDGGCTAPTRGVE